MRARLSYCGRNRWHDRHRTCAHVYGLHRRGDRGTLGEAVTLSNRIFNWLRTSAGCLQSSLIRSTRPRCGSTHSPLLGGLGERVSAEELTSVRLEAALRGDAHMTGPRLSLLLSALLQASPNWLGVTPRSLTRQFILSGLPATVDSSTPDCPGETVEAPIVVMIRVVDPVVALDPGGGSGGEYT